MSDDVKYRLLAPTLREQPREMERESRSISAKGGTRGLGMGCLRWIASRSAAPVFRVHVAGPACCTAKRTECFDHGTPVRSARVLCGPWVAVLGDPTVLSPLRMTAPSAFWKLLAWRGRGRRGRAGRL
jgi:hypothetical protein